MGMFDRFKGDQPTYPLTKESANNTGGSIPGGGGINLHKEKAGIILQKKNLGSVKAAVYLVLDYSGSMGHFYRDHTVQDFTERALALSVHLDDDGSVPVCLFDRSARKIEEVNVNNYVGFIDNIVARAGNMGTTAYDEAMHAVAKYHMANNPDQPALVIFQTDGSPDSRTRAEKALCDYSNLPIFWQFVGFGHDSFDFLKKLDELPVPQKRVVDNAGFFEMGSDPKGYDDETLYGNIMKEFPHWLRDAKRQGIVK